MGGQIGLNREQCCVIELGLLNKHPFSISPTAGSSGQLCLTAIQLFAIILIQSISIYQLTKRRTKRWLCE